MIRGFKADAVNVIGKAIGVLADQPGRIVAVSLAYSARISFAQTDVAQPRVDVGDGCYLSERLVDRACATRRDALDRAQVLVGLAYDLEHPLAKALDRLCRTDWPEVGGIGHKKGDDAAAIQVIQQLDGLDLHLPTELGVTRPGAAYPHHRPQRDI